MEKTDTCIQWASATNFLWFLQNISNTRKNLVLSTHFIQVWIRRMKSIVTHVSHLQRKKSTKLIETTGTEYWNLWPWFPSLNFILKSSGLTKYQQYSKSKLKAIHKTATEENTNYTQLNLKIFKSILTAF
jgi:hypothetical protein